MTVYLTHPNDILASNQRHRSLIAFLEGGGVPIRCLSHPPCRSSAESAAARAAAGAPGSMGAKALIVRTSTPVRFVMLVLPGEYRLCNEKVRRLLGKFRFATAEEILEVTDGLEPGMIPPFAHPVFPALGALVVDETIPSQPLIGFNAAHLERSVVMAGKDYIAIAGNPILASIHLPPVSDATT
jgi:prolyl-tRNA editing enzyme YbaK/EbsC (Cys-tRNA(Pro) deacylase)